LGSRKNKPVVPRVAQLRRECVVALDHVVYVVDTATSCLVDG
jgi:hypothetical protein